MDGNGQMQKGHGQMQNGFKYVYRMGMDRCRMDINMCTVWVGMNRCRMEINMCIGWAWTDAEWI